MANRLAAVSVNLLRRILQALRRRRPDEYPEITPEDVPTLHAWQDEQAA
jgi:hypothetical protein